jgi:inner membrane protein
MDNLCHTLAGAALAYAGLKDRTRLGTATLLIASNLPDLDVLVFATGTPAVAFRRGWTHGVLAQAVLPVLLTLVMLFVARRQAARGSGPPADWRWLLALSYLGVVLHVGMDLLNNYGVRILMPFETRWFYGDTLFIIDPWLWLILAAGVWLARRQGAPIAARGALVTAVLYVGIMLLSARVARATVSEAWRAANGSPASALMVGPVPVTPFRREVIIDAGGRYVTGAFTWLPQEVRFDPEFVPKHDDDPRVAIARRAANIRAFLVWARFPFWTLEPLADGSTRVTVGDMRFAGRLGRFAASTIVPATGD